MRSGTGRKAIPKALKDKIFKRQNGKCGCGCGAEVLSIKRAHARFDHNPPLALRPWNDTGTDKVPPANSIDHINMLTVDCDRKKTYGPRGSHTSIDSDRHAIDHTRRLAAGGRDRKGAPMDGSRDSRFKVCMGPGGKRTVERR